MKYTITINQLAAIGGGFNLDLVDYAIFDFIRAFIQSGRCETEQIGGKTYFWINPKLIIQQMPILGIVTTRGINMRFENLIREKLLERGPENKSKKKTYFALGEKVFCYDFGDWDYDDNNMPIVPTTNNANDKISSHGRNLPSGLGTNLPRDNNINYNNKNNICAKTSDDGFSADGSLFECDKFPLDKTANGTDCHEEPTPIPDNIPSDNEETLPRTKATLEERKEIFRKKCLKYVPKYGQGKVERFIGVWTEHNEGGRLMRFEMCKTFNIGQRLGQFRDYGHEREQFTPQSEHKDISAQEALKRAGWI